MSLEEKRLLEYFSMTIFLGIVQVRHMVLHTTTVGLYGEPPRLSENFSAE